MGGRKFRLDTHRKNEERRCRSTVSVQILPVIPLRLTVSIPRQVADIQPSNLVVSLPLSAFTSSRQPSLEALQSRVAALSLPSQWVFASQQQASHMTLCKLITTQPQFQASVSFSLTIHDQFSWTLSIGKFQLDPAKCPVLTSQSVTLDSVALILNLLELVDSCGICSGNSETEYLDILAHRLTTPCGSSGKSVKIIVN